MKWSTGSLEACEGVGIRVEMPESRSLLSGPGDKELYKLYIDLNLCPGASEHLFMGVK